MALIQWPHVGLWWYRRTAFCAKEFFLRYIGCLKIPFDLATLKNMLPEDLFGCTHIYIDLRVLG